MNTSGRVLVVEDEQILRNLAFDLLSSEGYEVRTAGDGEAGLEVLNDWLPDVILLDLMMPGIDAHTFRERQRATADVPVIILSGARDAISVADDLGAVATVRKPFDLDDLLDEVAAAIAEGPRSVADRGR